MTLVEDKKMSKAQGDIYGTFFIGDLEVALNVKNIYEVVNYPEVMHKRPLAPAYLVGIFNLRGLIIPVVNLKSLLGLDNSEMNPNQKIGIVNHEGAKAGLLFDTTNEILRVKNEEFCEFSYSAQSLHQVISGAIKLDGGNRILQVINPFALISIDNIPQVLEQQEKHAQGKIYLRHQHDDRKKCISFSVDGIKFGFEISGINEIIKANEIQSSAIQNEFCLGMINLRGQSIPVIEMRSILKMAFSKKSSLEERKILILKYDEVLFGLLIDSVDSIWTYFENDIMTIPLFGQARSKMFLGGLSIEGEDILLLDYHEVLTNNEIKEMTQGHSKIYGANSKSSSAIKKRDKVTYVSFKLDYLFGVSIKDIQEIINYSDEIMPALGMPAFVRGVLNLRGKLVTIIDTRGLYSMNNTSLSLDDSKILIFEKGEEKFGLIVDSVESIISVDNDKKIKVPSLMMQKVQNHFENDIKEIISFQQSETKEGVLIVLNIDVVTFRIQSSIAS